MYLLCNVTIERNGGFLCKRTLLKQMMPDTANFAPRLVAPSEFKGIYSESFMTMVVIVFQ